MLGDRRKYLDLSKSRILRYSSTRFTKSIKTTKIHNNLLGYSITIYMLHFNNSMPKSVYHPYQLCKGKHSQTITSVANRVSYMWSLWSGHKGITNEATKYLWTYGPIRMLKNVRKILGNFLFRNQYMIWIGREEPISLFLRGTGSWGEPMRETILVDHSLGA